jgi:hypothetical protein
MAKTIGVQLGTTAMSWLSHYEGDAAGTTRRSRYANSADVHNRRS